ncbi:prepilin-type N-terminal cleavage/methylation domain-containing protein, partial [Candidatus Woesebacteria bacterium]|nr:prepilin-type N-terminal cleavage/methylation domain-containing protein [Candidatus Woesebacteria bacterium]
MGRNQLGDCVHQKRKKNGFTLIELLVTTTIIVLLLLGVSSMFMTFLIANTRVAIQR